MNTKFLLSPAYLVSVGAMLVGALLAGTAYMTVGWILFITGLALNAMALVVLANREQLRRASDSQTPGRAKTSTATPTPVSKKAQSNEKRGKNSQQTEKIFPQK
ncbi:ATPase [Rothia sp. ZJ932]|uniref:ATPase n=1 Tax=Rothia sp. ZJ932 TaxID=2810516 RepID=UPI0019687DB6|nr:ATPase [Rothia sp. ZJ932]QRZ61609.1 ATPase [Rothia sp. ZJ932]